MVQKKNIYIYRYPVIKKKKRNTNNSDTTVSFDNSTSKYEKSQYKQVDLWNRANVLVWGKSGSGKNLICGCVNTVFL